MLNFFTKKRPSNGSHEKADESQPVTDQIGRTAGDVWRLLAEHGAMSQAKIAKQIAAPRDVVMQSIGWLAREQKIQIMEEKRVVTISLLPAELSKVA